jgi:hypothetical protein
MRSSNTDEKNKDKGTIDEEIMDEENANEEFSLDAEPRRIVKKAIPTKRKRGEFLPDYAEGIAMGSAEMKTFQRRHHHCGGQLIKLSPEQTEIWIKWHPEAFTYKGRGRPPKIPLNLWQVEDQVRYMGKWPGKDLIETITVTINPINRRILETKEDRIIVSSDK